MGIHISKFDYTAVPELLRSKYNVTGKAAQALVSFQELKNGDISYKVYKKLAVKVVFKREFTRLMIRNSILMKSDIYLGTKFLHPVGGVPDMQALDLERDDNIVSYIYYYLDLAIRMQNDEQKEARI